MRYETATKEQLLQICLWEECPIEYKYESARELQMRQWQEEFLPDLVRLWGEGNSPSYIATELGIEERAVRAQLRKHKLYNVRRAMG